MRSSQSGLILLAMLAGLASEAHAQWGITTSALPAWSSDASDGWGDQTSTAQDSWYGAPSGNAGCDLGTATCSDCCNKWYAVATGLVMTRNRAPANVTTVTSDDPLNVLMNTQSAAAGWTGGGQVTVGYAWNGAGGPSLATTYWGLAPMNGYSSVSDTTGNPATALSATVNFGNLDINGNPSDLYFQNAQQQALWRKDQVDNVEINVLTGTYSFTGFQVAGLAGFRYFRFAENLNFGSVSFGNTFDTNDGADAAYYDINVNNNLFGAQLGAAINVIMTQRLTVFAVPKVGLFGNQMNNYEVVYSGLTPDDPVAGNNENKSDLSVLSELDAGLSWNFYDNWTLTGGYRVVAVSNLALADNQYGSYGFLMQNGSLILQGAFFGLGFQF